MLNSNVTPLYAQHIICSTPLLSLVVWDELQISTSRDVCRSLKSTIAGMATNRHAFYLSMRPVSVMLLVFKFGFVVPKI